AGYGWLAPPGEVGRARQAGPNVVAVSPRGAWRPDFRASVGEKSLVQWLQEAAERGPEAGPAGGRGGRGLSAGEPPTPAPHPSSQKASVGESRDNTYWAN